MRVAIIGAQFPEYEKYCPHWSGMQAGLKWLDIPFVFLDFRNNKRVFEDLKEAGNFDLIIYGLRDIILDRSFCQRVREQFPHSLIVFWYGDYRDDRMGQMYIDCKETIDVMFVSNDNQEQYYKSKWNVKNIFFLPLAAQPLSKPAYNERFAFDFVFIGAKNYTSWFYERGQLISRFEEAGLQRLDSQIPEIRKRIFKAMPEIYSSSKVCLDVSHRTDVLRYTSIRYWEIPAFWGFPLTKRFPGCNEFYEDKVHRIYWDTFEEAIELKNYYLAHEEERMKLVKAGWEHTKQHHTYAKRFKRMFELLNLKI